MDEILIKAEELWFSYDDGYTHSLKGVDVKIRKGKRIAVMGANGSGKSTFFLCCNGILRPSRGRLLFHGEPVDYSRKGLLKLRQKVGIVFQDPEDQLFSASVYQEISFGLLNTGMPEPEAAEAVERIMEEMGIAEYRKRPVHALSVGQKKLVSIADVLVMRPEIAVLDEPAASLDPKHTALVRKLVDKMTKEGITVMISTHDVDYCLEWADEMLLFHDGRIEASGSPEDILGNEELLKKTHLEKPAVLKLYEAMLQKGVISGKQPAPKNLKALMEQILMI